MSLYDGLIAAGVILAVIFLIMGRINKDNPGAMSWIKNFFGNKKDLLAEKARLEGPKSWVDQQEII